MQTIHLILTDVNLSIAYQTTHIAILAVLSIALVPPLITKVRPPRVAEIATETDTIRAPTAIKPLTSPTTATSDDRKDDGEEEIENFVQRPLLQLVREASRG